MNHPAPAILIMLAIVALIVIITYRQRHRPSAWAAGGPRSAGGCLALPIGLALIGAALALAIPAALEAERALADARRNPPIRQLSPALAGQRILIEGTVSPQNTIAAWGAVAFERFEGEIRRPSKQISWRLAETKAPPLTIVTSGGIAQIENPADPASSGYAIERAALLPISIRVRGLRPNDRVLAIGTVRPWARGLYLDADEIRGGDYAAYLAEQNSTMARRGRLIVACMAGGGLLLLIFALLPAGWPGRSASPAVG